MSQQVSINGEAYNVTLGPESPRMQDGEVLLMRDGSQRTVNVNQVGGAIQGSISDVRITTGPRPGDLSMEGWANGISPGAAEQLQRNTQAGRNDAISLPAAAFIARMNNRRPELGDYVPNLPIGATVALSGDRIGVVNEGHVIVLPVDRTPQAVANANVVAAGGPQAVANANVVAAGGGGGAGAIIYASGGGGGGSSAGPAALARGVGMGVAGLQAVTLNPNMMMSANLAGRITSPEMDEIRAELAALRREVNELKAEKAAFTKAEETRNQRESRKLTV